MGLDAEVMARVERVRARGRKASTLRYVREGLAQFLLDTDRRRPALTLERPGQPPVTDLFFTVIANTTPWTYLGNRPLVPCPGASYETGLDVFAMSSLGTITFGQVAARIVLDPKRPPKGQTVVRLHDQAAFTVTGERPISLQLDGEALGEQARVRFESVPRSLSVIV